MKIVWEFTLDEANYVLASLGARPYNEVAQLLMRLKAQADAQVQQPAAVPVADASAETEAA